MRAPAVPCVLVCLLFLAPACTDGGDEGGNDELGEGTGETIGDGDGDTSGDGDGDTSGDGDGDGDTSGDGDGDGDGDTSGDGDGDGDTSGDGDGDLECNDVLISTNMGDLFVLLDPVNAPITVANFKAYVDESFYDGTIFHRVIDDFMIQGGGFTSGMVPKATMPPIVLETSPELTHVDGAISMARTQDPNSATSQFFICDGPQNFLDGDYAVFGVLSDGFDVLAAISAVPTGMVGQFADVPVEDVVINYVDYACD